VNCLCSGGDEGKGKSVFKLITTVEGDEGKEKSVFKLITTVQMGKGVRACIKQHTGSDMVAEDKRELGTKHSGI